MGNMVALANVGAEFGLAAELAGQKGAPEMAPSRTLRQVGQWTADTGSTTIRRTNSAYWTSRKSSCRTNLDEANLLAYETTSDGWSASEGGPFQAATSTVSFSPMASKRA